MGQVPYSTLNRYFQRISGELYLAIYATAKKTSHGQLPNEDGYKAGQIPQRAGDPVQMMGSAVFKTGRMIGTLTGEETRHALLLRRKALAHTIVSSYLDPADGNYRLSLRLVRKGNTKVDIDVKKDPPVVNVKVPLSAQVLSITSSIDYSREPGKQKLLKEAIEKDMQNRTKQLIQKTQKLYKAEPFIWYVEARKKFWTVREYESYGWENRYANADVNVKFDITIEMFGKQLDPPDPQPEPRGGMH